MEFEKSKEIAKLENLLRGLPETFDAVMVIQLIPEAISRNSAEPEDADEFIHDVVYYGLVTDKGNRTYENPYGTKIVSGPLPK